MELFCCRGLAMKRWDRLAFRYGGDSMSRCTCPGSGTGLEWAGGRNCGPRPALIPSMAPILYLAPTTDSALAHVTEQIAAFQREDPLARVQVLLPRAEVAGYVRRGLGSTLFVELREFYQPLEQDQVQDDRLSLSIDHRKHDLKDEILLR